MAELDPLGNFLSLYFRIKKTVWKGKRIRYEKP